MKRRKRRKNRRKKRKREDRDGGFEGTWSGRRVVSEWVKEK